MSQMGNLEKLGILVIVILVVVVGVVVITPKETLFPEIPDGEIAQGPELLEPLPPPPSAEDGLLPAGPGGSSEPAFGGQRPDPMNATDLGTKPAKGGEKSTSLPGAGGDPAAVLPKPAPEAQFREITIQAGDTLGRIAKRELGAETRWPEIVEMNPGLDPKRLRKDSKIKIPLGAVAKSPASGIEPSVAPPAAGTERIYVVQSGDTLSGIARQQLGSASKVGDLVAANPDTLKGTDTTLRKGMRLKIPAASAGPRASSEPTSRASAPPAPAPADGGGTRTYTVQKGDTLSSIASRMLGSTGRWREIANANEAVLHGGTDLKPGMTLTIPGDVSAR